MDDSEDEVEAIAADGNMHDIIDTQKSMHNW